MDQQQRRALAAAAADRRAVASVAASAAAPPPPPPTYHNKYMETFEKAVPVELTPHDIRDVDTVWAAARQQCLEKEARAKVAQKLQPNAQKLQADALHDELMSTTAGGGDDAASSCSGDSTQNLGRSAWGGEGSATSRSSAQRSSGTKRRKRTDTKAKIQKWIEQGKLAPESATWTTRVDDHANPTLALERAASRMIWTSDPVPFETGHKEGRDVAISEAAFDAAPDSVSAVRECLTLAGSKKFDIKSRFWGDGGSVPRDFQKAVKEEEDKITRALVGKDQWGQPTCAMCKVAGWAHPGSKKHLAVLADNAALNVFLGWPRRGYREYNCGARPAPGKTTIDFQARRDETWKQPGSGRVDGRSRAGPTAKWSFIYLSAFLASSSFHAQDLVDYWGDRLNEWPRAAGKLWRNGIMLKHHSRKPMAHLPANRVKGYVLGFVQYVAGSGVYTEKHRLWLPHMLPRPSQPTDEWWPLLICGLDDEANRQYQKVLHDDDEESMQVDLEGDAQHTDFMRRLGNPEPEAEPGAEPGSAARTGATTMVATVYATCAKQGLEATPTAWPIIMRSRL
jgi:hypothetical protein